MENETWLSLRDPKTKRFIKQIKINSELVFKDDMSSFMTCVHNMIANIDNKYMTIIKSSIEYGFQGLMDHSELSKEQIEIVKYNIQSDLLKLIDATSFDLDTKACNPYDIKKLIDAISNIYYCINEVDRDIKASSEGQKMFIEQKLSILVDKHNQYLEYLKNNYDFQRNCLTFTVPQNVWHALQISSAIETVNLNINEIMTLKMIEKKLVE